MFLFDLASQLLGQNRIAEEESGRVHEAVIAVITNITDPRKLCRVRLAYPSLGMKDESDWTPVVMPGAGKDRGWFLMPEVGDEVLVMFEHGDLDRPLVIGALWNGKDKPPDKNGGKNERISFVSKNGSKVILDDSDKSVTLEDGGGKGRFKMTEKAVTLEAAQGDATFQAKDELVIVAGTINLSGAEVQFVATDGINASADASITVNGSTVNIKGSQVDIHPGGVAKAAKADGTVSEVPDSGGGGGSGGGGQSPGGQAGPGGGGPGGDGPGGNTTPGSGGEDPPPGGDKPPIDPGKQDIPDQHSIQISVVDALDRPAVGIAYQLALPDGGTRTGTTDGDGKIVVNGIEKEGDCQLTFPAIDQQDQPPPASDEPASQSSE